MKVTKHAYQRGKERLGLPIEPFQRISKKAFELGIKHSDTKGSLSRYITKLYMTNTVCNNIRIYGEFVYLFSNETLITVLNLPNEYKAVVHKLK